MMNDTTPHSKSHTIPAPETTALVEVEPVVAEDVQPSLSGESLTSTSSKAASLSLSGDNVGEDSPSEGT